MAILSSMRRGSALDLGLALFAGAAFAFAAFAMPEWRLTQIALASGLADIFPPARPPLGFTARIAFAGGVGACAFLGALLLLRLADRPRVKKRETTEADAPPAPIRLRRADAHPDAPPRPPLAASDLGEPAEELLLVAEAPELPAFLVEQEPETVLAEPAEEAEAEQPLVWPQPEPVAAAPEPEMSSHVAAAEPQPVAVASEPEMPAAEPHAEPEASVAPPPPPAADASAAEPSLSKLMQRLEFGLARKERAAPLDPAGVAPPSGDAVGHRLRSAIGDLQKLAARG